MEHIGLTCDDQKRQRADAFIAEHTSLSRSIAAKLCDSGQVLRDGVAIRKKDVILLGDHLEITVPEAQECDAKPQDIPLNIVYEDSDLLVVNKPKGMVVHPAPGNPDGTLVNALLHHCGDSLSGINGTIRPGIVHRIDKDTSGLLMVAKNDRAHQWLAEQIKSHTFRREYEAIVYGNVKSDQGTVHLPIGRHPVKRKQMAVNGAAPRDAITHYRVLRRFGEFTHVRLILETGRTHQIRVHMASLGHPVAGDAVYGPKKCIMSLSGQCLHAKCVGFTHPNGQYMEFESQLPEYFTQFLEKLEKTHPNL